MPEDFQPNLQGQALTNEDIQNLVKSPFDKRIDITKKIAQIYTKGGFTAEQMGVAEQLFRTLIKDTEVEVRKTLAEALKDAPGIPNDVMVDLARDIREVALPVLQFSEVLTDADLIEIIESTEDANKQIAVSKRQTISPAVSVALIETKNDQVVDTLLHNKNATLSEEGYTKIVDNFADKQDIMQTMIEREALPVTVVEHLAKTISNAIYDQLSDKHKAAFGKVKKAGSDVATMKVIGMQNTEQEYYRFLTLMKRLQVSDKLIPISALCMGNVNLFEVRLAHHMKVPVLNVRKLMQDDTNRGFKALFERAGLPNNLYQATSLLVSVLREMSDELKNVRLAVSEKTSNRIIESLMEKADQSEKAVENIDYIVSLVRHNAAIAKEDDKE